MHWEEDDAEWSLAKSIDCKCKAGISPILPSNLSVQTGLIEAQAALADTDRDNEGLMRLIGTAQREDSTGGGYHEEVPEKKRRLSSRNEVVIARGRYLAGDTSWCVLQFLAQRDLHSELRSRFVPHRTPPTSPTDYARVSRAAQACVAKHTHTLELSGKGVAAKDAADDSFGRHLAQLVTSLRRFCLRTGLVGDGSFEKPFEAHDASNRLVELARAVIVRNKATLKEITIDARVDLSDSFVRVRSEPLLPASPPTSHLSPLNNVTQPMARCPRLERLSILDYSRADVYRSMDSPVDEFLYAVTADMPPPPPTPIAIPVPVPVPVPVPHHTTHRAPLVQAWILVGGAGGTRAARV